MTRAFGNRAGEAVFLCYHSIAERGAEYLALPPETFKRQLEILRLRGYRSGGLVELERITRGEQLAKPTVFLTFDDGYRDNAEVALPLLEEYGFKPLVFFLPQHADRGDGFTWPEVAEIHAAHPETLRSLTWSQVADMADRGAEFGSHTLTHPHLCELDDERLVFELAESRAQMQRHLGVCDMLAYPFGEWNERVARAAESAGYRFAFSLPQGPQAKAGPLCIPRINVDHRDQGYRFQFKLQPLGRRFLLSDLRGRTRRHRTGPRGASA